MSENEDLTSDSEDFVVSWVRTPGPDFVTNPGEPIAVPKALFTEPITLANGTRLVFDSKQNAFVTAPERNQE
jgi:hypothetical protein